MIICDIPNLQSENITYTISKYFKDKHGQNITFGRHYIYYEILGTAMNFLIGMILQYFFFEEFLLFEKESLYGSPDPSRYVTVLENHPKKSHFGKSI